MKASLKIESLVSGYLSKGKKHILSGPLNLEVQPGDLIFLIGPNGAGKSTLLKNISGLSPALEGSTLINNKDILSMEFRERAKFISHVFTDYDEFPDLNASQIVALGRIPHTNWLGYHKKEDLESINESIRQVGMEAHVEKLFDHLSDGEKQKIMIAKALAQESPVMILDEPTSHLDLPNKVGLLVLLKKLARKKKKSLVISIHDLQLALQLADQIWLLDQGKLHNGSPSELLKSGIIQKCFEKDHLQFDPDSGYFKIKE